MLPLLDKAFRSSLKRECVELLHCRKPAIEACSDQIGGMDIEFKLGLPGAFHEAVHIDRHVGFCKGLFSSEVGIVDTGTVRDLKWVFESARGAKQYFRRAMPHLSESDLDEECLVDQAEFIRRGVIHPPVADAPSFGDESVVLGGENDTITGLMMDVALKGAASDSSAAFRKHRMYFVIFRVGNVVGKLYVHFMSNLDPAEQLVRVYALANESVDRVTLWVQRFGTDCQDLLTRLPEDPRRMCMAKRAAMCSLAEQGLKLADEQPRAAPKVLKKACAVCGSTKKLQRCSGCRLIWFCSNACQKQGWQDGHKQSCSLTYQLKHV